jgi:glycosyltransferase involved in cell wall biosynthesis
VIVPRGPDLMPHEAHWHHPEANILYFMPLRMGGAERIDLNILSAFKEAGFNITLVSEEPADVRWLDRFRQITPDIFILPNFRLGDVDADAEVLNHLVVTRAIDVLFIRNSHAGYRLIRRVRAVTDEIKAVHLLHLHNFGADWVRKGAQYHGDIDACVVISENLKSYMRTEYGLTDKIHVIYNGINPGTEIIEQLETRIQECRRRLGIRPNEAVVGFCGRLTEQKDPLRWVESARCILDHLPDTKFVMIGEGELLESTRRRAASLGIDKHFVFTGYRDDAIELIGSFDILLLTSIYEGIPQVILEAFLAGVPVVTTDVGGVAEAVSGEVGIVVPANASPSVIAAAAEEMLLRKRRDPGLGEKCRSLVRENFSLDRQQAGYVGLIRDLTKRIDRGRRRDDLLHHVADEPLRRGSGLLSRGSLEGSRQWSDMRRQISRKRQQVNHLASRAARKISRLSRAFLRENGREAWSLFRRWSVPLYYSLRIRLASAQLIDEADALESSGAFNDGWYGGHNLSGQDRYVQGPVGSKHHRRLARQRYVINTWKLERYAGDASGVDDSPLYVQLAPVDLIRKRIASRVPRGDIARNADLPRYSIVTPYYRNKEFFGRCAASVAALMAADDDARGKQRIEWVIVNDDPTMDEAALLQLVPVFIRPAVRILSDVQNACNRGIADALNKGIRAARHEWILFLDNDDRIAPDASLVLDHYIRRFRCCRYISSAMKDIDDSDRIVRLRRHDYEPAAIFEMGMIAGHLKAVRRDLFDEFGLFDPKFTGCQDYDFALRVAINETLLIIPEYLYSYRWHAKSQSVSRFRSQQQTTAEVRKNFVRRFVEHRGETDVAQQRKKTSHDPYRGICLVRTQGQRLDLLAQAIRSIVGQAVPITPCVVVHGDNAAHERVKRHLSDLRAPVILLHADKEGRRRGYPLNVGLEYVEGHATEFDFMCLLDDDDIYYPLFGERISAALALSDDDVIYGVANQRETDSPPRSSHMPLPAACLSVCNFIPTNCYVVRTDVLTANRIRVPENMHYLEDWDFLLSLLQSKARFKFLSETVAEFRILGDGNRSVRRYPEHFQECYDRVIARGKNIAKELGLTRFYRDLMGFDFAARPPLSSAETDLLVRARDLCICQPAQ